MKPKLIFSLLFVFVYSSQESFSQFTQESILEKNTNWVKLSGTENHDSSDVTLYSDGFFQYQTNVYGEPIINGAGKIELYRVKYDTIKRRLVKDMVGDYTNEIENKYNIIEYNVIYFPFFTEFKNLDKNLPNIKIDKFSITIQNVYIDSLYVTDIIKQANKFNNVAVQINFKNCIINNLSDFQDEVSNGTIKLKYDLVFESCNIKNGHLVDVSFISNSKNNYCNNLEIKGCKIGFFGVYGCVFNEGFFLSQHFMYGNIPKIESELEDNIINIENSKFYGNVDLFLEDSAYSYNFINNELYYKKQKQYDKYFEYPSFRLDGDLNYSKKFRNVISNLNFSLKYSELPLDFRSKIFNNCSFGFINTDLPVYLGENQFLSLGSKKESGFAESVNGTTYNKNLINSLITKNDESFIICDPDKFDFENYDIDILDKIEFVSTYFLYNEIYEIKDNNLKTRFILLKKEEFFKRLDLFFLNYENYVRNKYVSTNTLKMDRILVHMEYNKEYIQWWYYIKTWNIPMVIWYWLKRVTINFGWNGLVNFFSTCFVIVLVFGFIYYFKFNKDIKIYHDEEDEPIKEIKHESEINYNTENLKIIKKWVLKLLSWLFFWIMPILQLIKLFKNFIISIFSKLSRYRSLVIIYNAFGEFLTIIKSLFKVENIKIMTSCMWFSFRTLIDIRFPSSYFKLENNKLFYFVLIEWLVGILMIFVFISTFLYQIPFLKAIIGV